MPNSTNLSSPRRAPYALGLDIGSESIGWAMLPADDPTMAALVTGAHAFDAGVEGDLESGRDESRAAVRRQARMPRRLLWRRAARMRKLARTLQSAGLFPPAEVKDPEALHQRLNTLDEEIRAKRIPSGDRVAQHLLPYRLRALALDEPLTEHELGRALYHLAQRRGFLSNKKAGGKDKKDKEELGEVKAGIIELQRDMDETGARTLGEHFSRLDADQKRIRGPRVFRFR